jgi:GntR family transcriptional regulator/MocR family aminotransferase
VHLADSLATLQLDASQPTPLFRQLYEGVKQAILGGRLAPGVQLPPTRDLAQLFGVSRQTVLNAYAQLTAEGYLSGTVGKGTFVSADLPLARKRKGNGPTAAVPVEQKPLRPLSARGRCFTGPQIALNVHAEGMPKAFRIGMPGLDVFPFDVWARLEARRWRHRPHHLGYGEPAGYLPLREALAVYLRAARGVRCEAEQILITSGSQQALYLIATLLLEPGDAAWVEEPGYRGITASLHAAQAKACAIPVDADGLDVEAGIRHHPEGKLVYVTPSHQLPLGVTMSLARRLELLAWAARNKAWVVEDDYDSEYRYTGPPLASLQSQDQTGCVLYVGTLSKVLFPGLRLGYMVLPPGLVDAFAQARALIDRHAAIVPQIVLADFITEGHFGRHIRRTREVYAERRMALLRAVRHELGEYLDAGAADAGLQLTAWFRGAQDDQAVARAAMQRNLEVRALSQFYNAPEGRRASGLVLGFAPFTPTEIDRGAQLLRKVLRDLG